MLFCRTYADTMRDTGIRRSLHDEGESSRCRYPHGLLRQRCVQDCKRNPDKERLSFAIGFETTTPPTAVVLKTGKGRKY